MCDEIKDVVIGKKCKVIKHPDRIGTIERFVEFDDFGRSLNKFLVRFYPRVWVGYYHLNELELGNEL